MKLIIWKMCGKEKEQENSFLLTLEFSLYVWYNDCKDS